MQILKHASPQHLKNLKHKKKTQRFCRSGQLAETLSELGGGQQNSLELFNLPTHAETGQLAEFVVRLEL